MLWPDAERGKDSWPLPDPGAQRSDASAIATNTPTSVRRARRVTGTNRCAASATAHDISRKTGLAIDAVAMLLAVSSPARQLPPTTA